MTISDFLNAAAIYAPGLALAGVVLHRLGKWFLARNREVIREEQESIRSQITGVESQVVKVVEKFELLNGLVERVTTHAEQIDKRVHALENIEKGKEIGRAELLAAAELAKGGKL